MCMSKRNTERKTMNGTAFLSEQNHGTLPMISRCRCCNKVMENPMFSMVDPKQPNGFWYEAEHLTNHKATVDRIGGKESENAVNCWLWFTVGNSEREKDTKEYLLSCKIYEGLNVTDKKIHTLYESVVIVNYRAINKVLSGIVASDCNRPIHITFEGGLKIVTRIATANDAMQLASKYIKGKNENKRRENLEELLKIAEIEE